MRYVTFLLVFVLPGFSGFAQQFLTGKVRNRAGLDTLVSVNVYNTTQRKHKLSDEKGNFRIAAQPGDTVIFSCVGYQTDTIPVTAAMLGTEFSVLLDLRSVSLQAVTVGSLSNYQLDSLERRQIYSWIYEQEPQPVIERRRQGDGVGVELNVIPHGSSEVRQRLQLKKRIIREEEQHYVDFRFSADYISRLTHLQGDSLKQFAARYRPSYDFCRKATNLDILVYINDSFKKSKNSDQ
ncbi:carboxypeptidase-like regulatory domain-containing protein [Flavitalea sp. BT771]|uniref:carboxypeptidase-like regulatory domain-containing protein n=1 Tax=Flavitalea sp. BT771 TaxID=3063329 RepID=UPI0026E1ADE7|nr:carboxypeptidase-like regulatory domain-containing protein [Flavitalea sp. BT771]MDO6429043.1 carboxypeptidase-like regulatory domain-containing protein [Flavitalea sp. BT771]MDV6218829.1 carboxypeptidase-like regulatory domain-containing protein [Flavitalea sp. BT771]